MHDAPSPRTYATTFIAVLCACTAARAGEPVRYAIDPVHTRVMFEIDHAGFSKAIGTVSGSEGSLLFDAEDWSTAKLDVAVPMQRLDMGDANWAMAVFAPRFLDVKHYPQARFVSSEVKQLEGNRGSVCGELTLHGVTRPLCMALTLNRIARYPLPPFRRTAGFSATATLKRSDFGMTSWQSLVGDSVELRIEAELTRQAGDAPAIAVEPNAH
ncbi:YceI family protein [Thermomonas sp. HDW16]|uniref:YceI family protein n=1 Tax=Thermomonas sp. HDW16 TaxID=2714945 RepID=UPI00140ADF80|nr:polyisoprenoid-binding protein [Thermomonas sp. HDW16]